MPHLSKLQKYMIFNLAIVLLRMFPRGIFAKGKNETHMQLCFSALCIIEKNRYILVFLQQGTD